MRFRATVLGVLSSGDGLASREELVQGANAPRLRQASWASPPERYRSMQDVVPVDVEHSLRPVGELVHLERHRSNLWAVAHLHRPVAPAVAVWVGDDKVVLPHDLFWSASLLADEGGDLLLRSASLTTRPARLGATPCKLLEDHLSYPGSFRRWSDAGLTPFQLEVLQRAEVAHLERRRRGGSLVIAEPEPKYDVVQRGRYRGYFYDDELVAVSDRRPSGALRWSKPHRGGILRVS